MIKIHFTCNLVALSGFKTIMTSNFIEHMEITHKTVQEKSKQFVSIPNSTLLIY